MPNSAVDHGSCKKALKSEMIRNCASEIALGKIIYEHKVRLQPFFITASTSFSISQGAIDSLEMKSFFEKCSERMRTPLSTLYGGNGFSEENEKVWINKHSVFLPPTVNYYDVVNNICFSMLKKCNDAFYTDFDMQGLAIKEYYQSNE